MVKPWLLIKIVAQNTVRTYVASSYAGRFLFVRFCLEQREKDDLTTNVVSTLLHSDSNDKFSIFTYYILNVKNHKKILF